MKKLYILFISCNLYFLQAQNVGIKTPTPTKMLDVNGDLRIRTLPTGASADKIIVTDAEGNILKQAASTHTASIGDIKDSYATADHDGWYLLNGRNIVSLSTMAQANAATLGFSTVLPDFTGSYTKMAATTETLNSSGGSATASILKANLPNFDLNAVTNTTGAHAHSYQDQYTAAGTPTTGYAGAYSGNFYGYYLYNSHTSYTSGAGNHLHTFALNSNGGNQAMNLSPAYIALKSFVYLGN